MCPVRASLISDWPDLWGRIDGASTANRALRNLKKAYLGHGRGLPGDECGMVTHFAIGRRVDVPVAASKCICSLSAWSNYIDCGVIQHETLASF
jgi:hypothetical protein